MPDENVQTASADSSGSGGGDSSFQNFLSNVDPSTGMPKADAKATTEKPNGNTETGKPGDNKVDKAAADAAASQSPQKDKPSTETGKEDWWDVVSKVDKAEIAKRKRELAKFLDMDDFDIDFSEMRKNGVDPHKFLEAKTRDWNKVSHADVIRWDLKQRPEFKDLPPEDFELIAEDTLGQYNLSAPTEPDEMATPAERREYEAKKADYEKQMKLKGIKFKADADVIRKKGADEDAKFTIPERKADEEGARKAEAANQERQKLIELLTNGDVTKKLRADKQFVIGEGDGAHKVPVDIDKLLEFSPHSGKFWSLFDSKDDKGASTGEIDTDLLFATINYAMNRKAYEKGLIDHGKSQQTEKTNDELMNPDKKAEQGGTGEAGETLIEAFMKRGKEVR